MFAALTEYDEDGKTPLELAIENNHLWYDYAELLFCLFKQYQPTAFLKLFKNILWREICSPVLVNLMKRKRGTNYGSAWDLDGFYMLAHMVLLMQ